jgi:hypothetical protein
MAEVATSIGAAQEAALAALPPSEKWWNPNTQKVESLSTSKQFQDANVKTSAEYDVYKARAEQQAREARIRFQEREGFDRMGGQQEEFDPADFETAPSTPARAGPGLAVSPSNVALGAAMGVGLVAGGVGLALASKESSFVEKTVRPTGQVPSQPVYVPPTPDISLPPSVPTVAAEFVPFSVPLVGVSMTSVFTRRGKRVKSRFRKFL